MSGTPTHTPQDGGSAKWVFGILLTAVIAFFVGKQVGITPGGHGTVAGGPVAPGAAPDPSVERFRVPVGNGPQKGSATAKVTIIQYSDFQCPFCGRVEPTMTQLEQQYGKDLRVVWKDNPLPFHPNAMPSASVARVANESGKFWEMHDILFKNQANGIDRPSLEKYAQEMGLDAGKVKDALDNGKYKDAISADQKEAANFGANGTPAFFINGRFLSGAQPIDAFKKIINEELANADKALRAGTSPGALYDTLTRAGKTTKGAGDAQAAKERPAAPDANTVYKVPLGDAPERGPKTAKVTIVQFSDFQCPYCSRVEPTISEIEKTYGKDVRVVWKNNPLPFHPNAMPAAEAAMAANDQGKFWEMHDKLFADQQHLDPATYAKYAEDLGLNVSKWKSAVDGKKYEASIKADQADAAKFGANGTPAFFINGKFLSGAQPLPAFKAVIDKELENANALLKSGTKPADLYATITKDGKDKVAAGAAPSAPPADADANVVYKALIEDAPVKGAKNAKVTIVAFSDFQCPFCSRVEPTLAKVMETYPNDVRMVFKELPLPFHDKAHAAAEAALAAKAQGKFWQMHDKMFADQQHIDRPGLEATAAAIGLNVDKFKSDLDSGKWKTKVDAETAEGNKIGARGTPSFFINGKKFVGAQPFEAFKAKIDEEIKNANTMIAHGTPAGKVYDELMKTAKEGSAPPPQQAAGGGEDENKIYKVDAGNAPSVGPKNAPVQIVEFSDFQCPFCGRVVPTVKQIEEKYKGKVRISFRNFPLPMHNNAELAAEASMAANEQGKFWEMHDKMFGNQQALDRASLEKYAGEIGLNVSRFKEGLDNGKFKQEVSGDVAYANSLGTGGFGTPTFFINGKKIAGAMPIDSFAAVIDEELKKKGK